MSMPDSDPKLSKEKKANEYNGRVKSGRQSGGQPGHAAATLIKTSVEEKIQSGCFKHRIEN